MTLLLLLGCFLVAFGPALALFLVFISKNGQLVILMLGSSFFWLLSIFLASLVWYIFASMRTHLLFILPFAVLFQEAMRWVFHKVYIRAEKGLTRESGGGANPFSFDYFSASLAIGLGFGVCQATIMYGTILTEAGGPGSLYTPACPHVSLFILSAVLALASIAMHVFLTIIAFDTFKTMAWRPFLFKCGIIVGGHLVISLMTLLNQEGGNCLASMVVIYVVLALIGVFALWLSFTSVHLLKRSAATNR